MASKSRGIITVAAGTNGAGKSALIGEYLSRTGVPYFNPDSYARTLIQGGLPVDQANGAAWSIGFEGLQRAIDSNADFTFETTLGGASIARELHRAADAGLRVRIWYIGLSSPEQHIARVKMRVARGGHDIPEEKIRERYVNSQLHLIELLPRCDEVHVFDNSAEDARGIPRPVVVLRMKVGRLTEPTAEMLLTHTPPWAQPLAAAALQIASRRKTR